MADVSIDGVDYVSSATACALLGIKPATLYAYVSRGKLSSYRRGSGRARLYARSEVERLAQLERAGGAVRVELPEAESWMGWTS